MQRTRSASAIALVLSQLFLVLPARAAVFPDVPDGHMYQSSIEALVSLKIVNGNPDGTFKPEKSVNRAELLAMLYRAAGKTPDPKAKGCFSDVQPGSWYELTVCDAAAKKYVQGYDDPSDPARAGKTFKPNKEVNRVEALKMIMLVLGIHVPNVNVSDAAPVKLNDISASAWYTMYVYHAYSVNILPIAGQSGSSFSPDWALKRGEAAAYISNALKAPKNYVPAAKSSSSAAAVVISSAPGRSSRATASVSSEAAAKNVPASFDDSAIFNRRRPMVYEFTVDSALSLDIKAQLGDQYSDSALTCRLYHIESTGFASEYYLGYQEKHSCTLRAKLVPGNYQLELQPNVNDASFTVTSREGKGDGNDGFSEAKTLVSTTPRTDFLDVADLADWYTFKLTGPQSRMVELTNDAVSCLIYPMADVDIYGFEGPKCNEQYEFPAGTYYVGVLRKNEHVGMEGYTLRIK